MNTKLTNITTQYSKFSDNQVLTKGQLNQFLEYFEDQDHLSRISLSGVGIVCGFDVTYDSDEKEIKISKGHAITTDGDLLTLVNSVEILDGVVKKQEYKLIEEAFKTYTYYRSFNDRNAEYPPFFNEEDVQIELLEIFSEGDIDTTNATYINFNTLTEEELAEILEDKVLLLYLENYDKQKDLCSALDCDNQGVQQVAKLHVLLVSSDDANSIASTDAIYNKHNWQEVYSNLREVAVERDILNEGNTNSTNNLKDKYYDLIKENDTLDHLTTSLDLIFEKFNQPSISSALNSLFNFTSVTIPFDFQYRYDLLKDLVATYTEIKELLLHINVHCCPEIGSFPKHIMLGGMTASEDGLNLRHRFYKSPIVGHEDSNLQRVISLLSRIKNLVNHYTVSEENEEEESEEIKITPSYISGVLGEKAIPFYFDVNSTLLEYWDFDKTINQKQQYNVSYHTDALASDLHIQNALHYTTNQDFYRIEGHIGKSALLSKDEIIAIQNAKALDFECVLFSLQDTENPFDQFVVKHPSITHQAGVQKGGTFILVASQNTIIADFNLSYKIPETVQRDSCCYLKECSFPWISSLKYLNNLSRSLKGTQSDIKIMPKEYILQILQYKINGENLITTSTILSIPLEDIFLRRIHAITNALNNRFNEGLVFDFNENQKRFVITAGKEDTYMIRLRDITLGFTNAIYTYSNNGMFRNNKVFRNNAMICRDLKTYNPLFYKNLQEEITPINKDDDYGAYDEKWAKWSSLIEKLTTNQVLIDAGYTRMVKTPQELSVALDHSVLPDLLGSFQSVVPTKTLRFFIDGDWVNGTWVNDFMLTHHRQNRNNTHDDIVLFVNLRKFLHNETGVTKMSIYIDNQEYTPDFDEQLENYKTYADIYFGMPPTGINAFRINPNSGNVSANDTVVSNPTSTN